MQFLKSKRKGDPHMVVVTDDIYLTWISVRPYGVKLSIHGRWVKLAVQWGRNGSGTNQ